MKREYYICDDKLFCMTDGRSEEITEKETELIDEILERIENYYPEALKALNECYAKSNTNRSYFNFLRVRRFLKCNFGDLDTSDHDDVDGKFNFERIHCPLRGECKYECVICNPKFNTRLSDSEMRVMRLFYKGESYDSIAEQLYNSIHTVKNHIKASYAKLGLHNKAEFITYAHKNHLFD